MGTWGVKAYENDSSADWCADVLAPVAQKVEELLNAPVDESSYDEYRAAAWMLTKIGRVYVYDVDMLKHHLTKLHDRLQTIRADKDWIDSWQDNEDDIIKEMDEQIAQIQRVCNWNGVTVNF